MYQSDLITILQCFNVTGAVYGVYYQLIVIIKIPCPYIFESRTVNIARILGILSQPVIEFCRIKAVTKLIAYILPEYTRILFGSEPTGIISPFQEHINVISFIKLSLHDIRINILEFISSCFTCFKAPFHKIGYIITLVKLFLNDLSQIFTEHLTDLETRCFRPCSKCGKIISFIKHGFQTSFYIFREYISGFFACLLTYLCGVGKFGDEIIDSSLTCSMESKLYIRTYLFHTFFKSLRKVFFCHVFNVSDTALDIIEYLFYIRIAFFGHSRLCLFELIVIAYRFLVVLLCFSRSA